MQIRPTAFTIGLIIHFSIALFSVYTEFGIDSHSLFSFQSYINNTITIVINTEKNILVVRFHFYFCIISNKNIFKRSLISKLFICRGKTNNEVHCASIST